MLINSLFIQNSPFLFTYHEKCISRVFHAHEICSAFAFKKSVVAFLFQRRIHLRPTSLSGSVTVIEYLGLMYRALKKEGIRKKKRGG